MIRVDYLADHMERAPLLATLHHSEWRELLPDWSEATALAELSSHDRRRAIPTTLIAFEGDDMLGSVSLLAVDHERLAHLSPWLGSLLVLPQHRGHGVARLLIDHLVEEAGGLGVTRLYAYTPEHEAMYVHLGWSVLGRVGLGGSEAAVVCIDLPRPDLMRGPHEP